MRCLLKSVIAAVTIFAIGLVAAQPVMATSGGGGGRREGLSVFENMKKKDPFFTQSPRNQWRPDPYIMKRVKEMIRASLKNIRKFQIAMRELDRLPPDGPSLKATREMKKLIRAEIKVRRQFLKEYILHLALTGQEPNPW